MIPYARYAATGSIVSSLNIVAVLRNFKKYLLSYTIAFMLYFGLSFLVLLAMVPFFITIVGIPLAGTPLFYYYVFMGG